MSNKVFSLILFMFCCTSVIAQSTERDAAEYQTNQPFGWATCSDVSGTKYTVDGGKRSANPQTIVLYSTGGDERQTIINAIKQYDIVILDGSKGDFIVSKSMNISGVKNKTIVGRNGARLCTKWYMTADLKAALEAANLGQYSSGSGTGGTLSNGASVDEARELHTRQTIIDHTGDNSEAYRGSGLFSMDTSNENIVIRNIVFQGPGSIDVGGSDIISNNGATHVWIDHCEFIDGMDGNLDSGKREGSEQFVTYSWNIFRYTDRSFSHPYSNGVGWNKGYLQYITYSHNIWGEGCTNRLPQADWVYIHLANNYHNCPGNSVGMAVNANSHALVENNYAVSGVNNPFKPGNYSNTYYVARNNYGLGSYNNKSNTSESLDVPYEYMLIPVADVPDVLQGKHGSGATLDDMIDSYLDLEETPEEPDEPVDLVYKNITEDMVLLTTTDNLTGKYWVSGGESSTTKAGTIDPNTGQTVEKYSGGGVMLKKGNSSKYLETYVTGAARVTAYGCTAGSTDRALVVTATAEDGTSTTAKGVSSEYTSVAVPLELDHTKKYKIEYTGVLAEDEEAAADVVLHGVLFQTQQSALGIDEIVTERKDNVIYTISGIRINGNAESLPKGLYIINGKKIVVR
ncbi:MAG: hypothetical protein J6C66_05185 [Prevotella sp.]|nr:hypothetical protein [Prevotella sp.]